MCVVVGQKVWCTKKVEIFVKCLVSIRSTSEQRTWFRNITLSMISSQFLAGCVVLIYCSFC